jgi:hypothetical protein
VTVEDTVVVVASAEVVALADIAELAETVTVLVVVLSLSQELVAGVLVEQLGGTSPAPHTIFLVVVAIPKQAAVGEELAFTDRVPAERRKVVLDVLPQEAGEVSADLMVVKAEV